MKKLFKVFSLMLVVIMAFPFSVMASENDQQRSDLIGAEEGDFEKLIAEIQRIKAAHPDYSEEMIMSFLGSQSSRCGKRDYRYLECAYRFRKETMYSLSF